MSKTSSTSGFVLAGGQSRRMGGDKATLPWGQGTLVGHMAQLLSTVAAPVQIVGRGELPDRLPGKGPLGGILTALECSRTETNLVVAVDLPLLTPEFLRLFHSRFLESGQPVLTCRTDGRYPLCLGILQSARPDVERRVTEGRLSVQDFIDHANAEVLEQEQLLELGVPSSIFANVNTTADWDRLTKNPR